MRPSDEDQSSSRRPNLMSSTRRTANEIHILAMLDRHEAGGLAQRLLRGLRRKPRAPWYGAAGVLVCAMVGALAWLARDSGTAASGNTALAGAPADKRTAGAAAASASLALPEAATDAAPDALPAAGATIVDVAPAPAARPAAPPPPLPQKRTGRITPHEAAHEPQRLAAHAVTPKDVPPAAAARAKPLAHAEARNRRAAASSKAAPKTGPEAVDTDVALISAIIQHANARQEAEEAARKP